MGGIVKIDDFELVFLSDHLDRINLANAVKDNEKIRELVEKDSSSVSKRPIGAYIVNDGRMVQKIEREMRPKRITVDDILKDKRKFLGRDFRDLREEPFPYSTVTVEYNIPTLVLGGENYYGIFTSETE